MHDPLALTTTAATADACAQMIVQAAPNTCAVVRDGALSACRALEKLGEGLQYSDVVEMAGGSAHHRYIGRGVRKALTIGGEAQMYDGTVDSYDRDAGRWTIKYDNDKTEQLGRAELERVLTPGWW